MKERRAVVLLVGGTLIATRLVGQVQLGVSHHRRDGSWALVSVAIVLMLVLVLVVGGACLLVAVRVVSVHDGVAEIPKRLGGPREERHHQQENQASHLLSLTEPPSSCQPRGPLRRFTTARVDHAAVTGPR